MPPLDEHTESPRGSFDMTRPSSMYTPLPHTANNVPLLQSNDLDTHHLSPDHPGLATRASFDSINSSAEDSSQQHYTDDAPPYETVILNDPPVPASTSPPVRPSTTTPPPTHTRTSTEQSGRRRSVFASIFNSRSSRMSTAPAPQAPTAASPEPRSSSGHTREGSGPSVMSIPVSERDQRRSRILRHHPSQSGSGSMFSLLSRTRSGQNLNGAEGLTSPSMISLHSISAPLPHTLVKTEFTYPKGGPTPDQLRLISSRESFARFGRPYGQEAIAFAASTSRAELEPPPGFEEVAGPGSGGPSSSSQARADTPNSGSDSNGEHADDHHAEANTSSSSESSQHAVVQTHVLPGVAEVESPTSAASPSVLVSPVAAAPPNDAVSSVPSPSPLSADAVAGASPLEPSPQPLSQVQAQADPALVSSQLPASSSSSASPPAEPPSPAPITKSSGPAPVASNAPPSAFKGFVTTPTPESTPISRRGLLQLVGLSSVGVAGVGAVAAGCAPAKPTNSGSSGGGGTGAGPPLSGRWHSGPSGRRRAMERLGGSAFVCNHRPRSRFQTGARG